MKTDKTNPIAPYNQNWGLTIGTGVVILGLVIMLINFLTYDGWSDVSLPSTMRAVLGQLICLTVSLCLGGLLLWHLLKRRRTPGLTYLETHLQKALSYMQKIEALLKGGTSGHEQQLLVQIQTWWQTIEAMAHTLADLSQNDQIIQGDLQDLPEMVEHLEKQLSTESNALLRADLQQMLTQRQNQFAALEQLQITRRRAEIQIERTIAVLGTIYSQLLTYRSTFHVVDYRHLADNVSEEVQHLQDYLEALREVKDSNQIPASY